jgi:hypothetical protein
MHTYHRETSFTGLLYNPRGFWVKACCFCGSATAPAGIDPLNAVWRLA